MSSIKLDVLWSPVHQDKFIVWGPDITLYEVLPLKDIEKKTSFTQISSTRGAIVVASQSANGVRCVDISSIQDQQDPLLALGHTNGRVTLTSLKQTYDTLGLVGREFVPQYSRMCNSVAWNPVETNILAAGLEKHRSDHSVLLWDVTRGNGIVDEAAEVSESDSEAAHPIAEMGLSETTHHVAWARFANRTLLASMNVKYIKIFDLRDLSKKEVQQTSSRHCYGVCADPFHEWRFASRGDNVAAVWDARALQRPLHAIQHAKPLAALHWCPTRRNLLLALQRDSNCVQLHDIQQSSSENETECTNDTISVGAGGAAGGGGAVEVEGGAGRAVLSRSVGSVGARGAVLAACAPHPSRAGPLLCVTHAGGLVEYTICERVTVAWGARGGLVWGGGGGALRMLRDDFYEQLRDISYVMRKRALTDYGLKSDLWQNADLADDESISGLWHFLALSKSLVEDGVVRGAGCPGVAAALRGEGEGGEGAGGAGYRSEALPMLLPDAPSRRVMLHRGPERARALQLCAWGWGWDNALAGVERAEAEGTPCRAAALAAFHLRLRSALDVLHRARSPSLKLVALGAAGLGDERLWRDALAAAAPALPDAYLRAMLAFLAAVCAPAPPAPQAPDYSAVLEETEMRLEDRVAFACLYLGDRALQQYVARTSERLLQQGSLAGMLLTGASPEGVELLQRWVEGTGDVQTAALVAARCFPPELLQDARVQRWIASYRALLEGWQLWWARCALDTCLLAAAGGAGGGAGGGAAAAGGGVVVACTYCGKSVAAPPAPRRPPRLPPPHPNMKQMCVCPNCRKPLARCGVCGLHLGGGGAVGGAAGGAGGGAAGGAPFGGWFSWCVACRHGGHAQHLLQWFQDHTECPVSNCNCHCSTLDPPDRH